MSLTDKNATENLKNKFLTNLGTDWNSIDPKDITPEQLVMAKVKEEENYLKMAKAITEWLTENGVGAIAIISGSGTVHTDNTVELTEGTGNLT
jgi:hypothetical protein